MKITVDASTIHGGGGLEHLKSLISYLLKRKYDITLICPHHLKNVFRGGKLNFFLIKRNILSLFLFYLLNKKKIQKDFYFSLNGLFIPKKSKGIIFFHNLLIFDDQELDRHNYSFLNLKAKILRYLFKINYKKSKKAFFFSESSRKIISKSISLNKKKDHVIHHGINQNYLYKRKKKRVFNKIKLIYPSSLLYYKNHIRLLNALSNFEYKNFEIEIYFIGQIFDFIKNRIDKYQISNNKISLRYLGELNQKSQFKIFKKMDAIIFPSSCETFGLSIYEGALSGLPVLCSDKITCKEILGKNAFYFNPFISKSIIKAVKDYIDNNDRSYEFSLKNQKNIKKLIWSNQIKNTIDMIKRI